MFFDEDYAQDWALFLSKSVNHHLALMEEGPSKEILAIAEIRIQMLHFSMENLFAESDQMIKQKKEMIKRLSKLTGTPVGNYILIKVEVPFSQEHEGFKNELQSIINSLGLPQNLFVSCTKALARSLESRSILTAKTNYFVSELNRLM